MMHPTLRAILSVIGGVLAGGLVVTGIQSLSPYQAPPELRPNVNLSGFTDWVKNLPTEAYYWVLASYIVGCFVAGIATHLIGRPSGSRLAWFTGLVLVVFSVGNFLAFPHPEWLTYSSCIGMPISASLGGALIGKKGL
jgi:hypothetical protein